MDREQHPVTIIDLDNPGSRRSSIVIAIVAVLLAALVVAPSIIHEGAQTIAPGDSMPAGRAVAPAPCRPSFDVPQMLDPLARVVLPGWTRLCGWISQSDLVEPLDPSG